MQPWPGEFLVAVGVFCIPFGLILWFAPKVPRLGRLAGDVHTRGKRFSFHIPAGNLPDRLASC